VPLNAAAFLAIWHDIAPDSLAEWNRWHTIEHMPERVGIPGFLAGRRYMNLAVAQHVCFTMYEGSELDVFNSPAYLDRLNAPTPWTRKMSPAFRNFMRGACRCIASTGHGTGGNILTLRYNRDPGASAPAIDAANLVGRALEQPGIVAAHVGQCEHAITEVDTSERATRSATGETRYDAVAIVEAIGRDELIAARRELTAIAAEAADGYTLDGDEIYTLAYHLRKEDL
jgi:hypothetical protein